MWVSVSCKGALGVCLCGLDVEVGSSHLFLIVVCMCEDCLFLKGVYMSVSWVPVSLIEQVGLLCMGSRQPIRCTADCGQAYCAQHTGCGSGTDTLWLDADFQESFFNDFAMILFHNCHMVQILF